MLLPDLSRRMSAVKRHDFGDVLKRSMFEVLSVSCANTGAQNSTYILGYIMVHRSGPPTVHE
jgi:hypothetical protein